MYPRILQIAEEKRDNAILLLNEAFSLVEEMKSCIKQTTAAACKRESICGRLSAEDEPF
jgi:hypothetical protein